MTLIDFARRHVAVTGSGAVCGPCDSTPFLKSRKMRKFMGQQDEMAVAAAAHAIRKAGLQAPLGERCGLFLSVGYIPFEREDIDQLLDASLEDERFSMQRFAANAFSALNPLLTFRVLPNMPAFHVSLNLDIQGPYVVSYPGAGQFYVALEEALAALESNVIDVALVGGVADQRNILVEHHFSRITPPVESSRLVNAASFLVLQRANAGVRLVDYSLKYAPVDPFDSTPQSECLSLDGRCIRDSKEYGPASLPLAIDGTRKGRLTHRLRTRDGFQASSVWDIA